MKNDLLQGEKGTKPVPLAKSLVPTKFQFATISQTSKKGGNELGLLEADSQPETHVDAVFITEVGLDGRC